MNYANGADYEQFGYDAAGNVTSIRKRDGQTITQAYDNLNRLIGRQYADSTNNVTFTYDLRGLKTVASYANAALGQLTYTWDNAGRLASQNGRFTHLFDAAGNRTRQVWPDGFYVETRFDALNRPTEVLENGLTKLASYTYDDLGRQVTTTLGNGTTSTRTYGSTGGLSTLNHDLAGAVDDLTLTFARNQIAEITSTTTSNDAYQWRGAQPGTQSYASNGLNQYTTVAGAALAYDTRGNLKTNAGWTYGYDADNRLRSASKTGTTATLDYDPEGRLGKTTINSVATVFEYDGGQVVQENNGPGTLQRRYVYGLESDAPVVMYDGAGTAAKTWLYRDQLGSVVATSSGAGTRKDAYTYGPFGEPNVVTGVRFRYTGQWLLPELGLYYYKAWFYSPDLGRFMQTDPIGYQDDLNLYAYVKNNPANYVDPDGRVAQLIWGGVIGGGVNLTVQMLSKNGTFMERLSQVDPWQLGAATLAGAASGGISALAGTATTTAGAIGANMIGNAGIGALQTQANAMAQGRVASVQEVVTGAGISALTAGAAASVGAVPGALARNATAGMTQTQRTATENLMRGIQQATPGFSYSNSAQTAANVVGTAIGSSGDFAPLMSKQCAR